MNAKGLGLILACVFAAGCSKEKAPEPAQADAKQVSQAASPAALVDEVIPPVVRMPWKGDLDEMVKRRVIRVLLPFRRPEFFYMEGKPAGILQEAFQELERVLNEKFKTKAANHVVVALLPTPQDQLRERMEKGLGDIAAFGIVISEENKKIVDFTVPTMTGLKIVVVTGPAAPEIGSVEDLSGKEVWVNRPSRAFSAIAALNEKLKSQNRAPAKVSELDPVLEPGDVMEMVNAGSYPIVLMQSRQAEFWGRVFKSAKPRMDLAVAEDVEIGWAVQKQTPKLRGFLDDFIKTHGVGTSFGNTLLHRYLTEAKYIRNATDENEMTKFRATAPVFKKYGAKYEFDALMLMAQGYQESRLDQKVRSHAGAVGIMQVLPTTAASSPVKIPDISTEENNIHAGVRLMHFLVNDHFNESGLDPVNRTLFAFAAYNAGPSKVTRCRAMAKEMGYDPNKWFGNVEVAVAKVVGRETTQYVANIYKYYISYRLARGTLARREEAVKKPGNGRS